MGEPWLKMSVSSAADVMMRRVPAMLEVLVVVSARMTPPLKRSPPAPVMSPSDWLRPEKFIVILSRALL
jgi:hypothetical protein